MATKPLPSPELLRKLLRYDPETGILTWKWRDKAWFLVESSRRRWNTRFAGKEALTAIDVGGRGYKHGSITVLGLNKAYAHRVAYTIYHGDFPEFGIDHINGDPTDNRIANLRDVSQKINSRNSSRRKNNTSGVTGVYWNNQMERWCAQITVDGRTKSLGLFASLDLAIYARKEAEAGHDFHANHGRIPII